MRYNDKRERERERGDICYPAKSGTRCIWIERAAFLNNRGSPTRSNNEMNTFHSHVCSSTWRALFSAESKTNCAPAIREQRRSLQRAIVWHHRMEKHRGIQRKGFYEGPTKIWLVNFSTPLVVKDFFLFFFLLLRSFPLLPASLYPLAGCRWYEDTRIFKSSASQSWQCSPTERAL